RHFPGSCIALQAPEVSAQLGGALVTDVAIFLQRLIYDSFQLRRHFRIEPERRGRLFAENGIQARGAGVSTKRKRTGGGLVSDRTERKDIGTAMETLSQRLLGRH